MGTYKNDYSKNEDHMLYELHEIQHKLASLGETPRQINENGRKIIEKYHLNDLKVISTLKR